MDEKQQDAKPSATFHAKVVFSPLTAEDVVPTPDQLQADIVAGLATDSSLPAASTVTVWTE